MGNKIGNFSKSSNNNNIDDDLNIPQQQNIQYQQYSSNTNSEPQQYGQPSWQFKEAIIYNDDDKISPRSQPAKPTDTGELFNLQEKLKLQIKLKQKAVQMSSASNQTFPLLVTLDVESIKSSNKAAIDLVCVIDHSGSMEGEKLRLLQDTFKYLLELLDEEDRLSIVIFDDKVRRITPLLKMNQKNKDITLIEINKITANGGTTITLGMEKAVKILKERKYINSVTSIFLLSDGLDGGAISGVKALMQKQQINDTYTINTFGFGKDHDAKMMNEICSLKDGKFYFIEKLDTVDECFVDCLGGLISVVGQDLILDVKTEVGQVLNGIQLTKAFGVGSMWENKSGTYRTTIAQLISGKTKNYVLEVQIPKSNVSLKDEMRNIKIVSASVTVKDLKGNKISKTAELIPTFYNEEEEMKDNDPDRDVMFHYYRVKGADIMETARLLSDQRKYADAKTILMNLKEELSNSKLKDDEELKLLIKDLDAAIQNVRPEVYESVGQQYMMQNVKAQMCESSNNIGSALNYKYQNQMQTDMVTKTKARKFIGS